MVSTAKLMLWQKELEKQGHVSRPQAPTIRHLGAFSQYFSTHGITYIESESSKICSFLNKPGEWSISGFVLNTEPFFFFFFFFLLYNTVLFLPYIDMNPPRVYMSSQSWTSLPPPSPYHLSGPSQCTSPKHPVSCIEPRLAIHFLHDSKRVSMPFSQIIPPSPSPTESKSLFYTSVSLLLSHIQGYHYHLSKFHIYVLVYCIGVFLSGLLHSV